MTMQGSPGASPDAIELLTGHHRKMEQLWTQVQAAHANGSEVQMELAQEIVTILSQHDAIGTQFLYPELRSADGADGQQLAEQYLDTGARRTELSEWSARDR